MLDEIFNMIKSYAQQNYTEIDKDSIKYYIDKKYKLGYHASRSSEYVNISSPDYNIQMSRIVNDQFSSSLGVSGYIYASVIAWRVDKNKKKRKEILLRKNDEDICGIALQIFRQMRIDKLIK